MQTFIIESDKYFNDNDVDGNNIFSVIKFMNNKYLHGFSLIELMVVMLLIGIFVVGVTLAVNPRGSTEKQLNAAGEKIFAQILYAQDEALVRNEALGIVINQANLNVDLANNYEWHRYSFSDNGRDDKESKRQWIKTLEPLGEHAIDKEFMWSIKVEDISIEENLDRLLNEDDTLKPVIVFYPSGEISEFIITLAWSDEFLIENADMASQRYQINIDERGELLRYRVNQKQQ
jgi:prepilin-type N-terminal cleavage/methylation domain-containing protein